MWLGKVKTLHAADIQNKNNLLIVLAVLSLTFIALAPVLNNQFTNWDDHKYILENNLVKELSFTNLKSIFGTYLLGNYHPLTVLSYALEHALFEDAPFYYHAGNLLLHLCNTFLVFLVVMHLTISAFGTEQSAPMPTGHLPPPGAGALSTLNIYKGGLITATVTSLLFGIHPMHVEPVAWVSGRKELLYTFFFLLALIQYIIYVKQGKHEIRYSKNYQLTLLWFLFACLSKGVAVVLPVALLIVDYFMGRKINRSAIAEKTPFFIISVVFGIVAIFAQQSFDAFHGIQNYSVIERLLFACYGLLLYLFNLVYPLGLSCFYPYPEKMNGLYPLMVYLSPVIMGAAVFLVWRHYRHDKAVVFGALFFLSTIFLVLQLAPVGESLKSDRYTYLPYIGLFFLAGHLVSKILIYKIERYATLKPIIIVILAAGLLIFPALTWKRCQVWQDSFTLWNDVISKYKNVWVAYNNRGLVYLHNNQLNEAIFDFNAAIQLRPYLTKLYFNRAYAYFKSGNAAQAIKECDYAISIDSTSSGEGYANRGSFYMDSQQYDLALKDFNTALSLNSKLELTYLNRGKLYSKTGKWQQAINDFNKVLELNPYNIEAYDNRGFNYINEGNYLKAIDEYTAIINIDRGYSPAYFNRAVAYYKVNDHQKALNDLQKARELGFAVDERFYQEVVTKTK